MRACAAPRRSAALVLVLGALLLAALSAQAGPVRTIHLRLAGEETALKTAPVSDGRDIYLPLETLRLLGASYALTRHDEAAVVTSRYGVRTEVALARPGGTFMLPLSDLARALGVTYTLSGDSCDIHRPGDPATAGTFVPSRTVPAGRTVQAPPAAGAAPLKGDSRPQPAASVDSRQTVTAPAPPPPVRVAQAPTTRTQPVGSPDSAPKPAVKSSGSEAAPPQPSRTVTVTSPQAPGRPAAGTQNGGRLQNTDTPDGPPTKPDDTQPPVGTQGTTPVPAGPVGHIPPVGPLAAPANKITDVSFEAIDDRHARLHVRGTGRLAARALLLGGGGRLALDIANCGIDLPQRDWPVQHPFVSGLHVVEAEGPGGVRVVLDLERVVGWYTVPEEGGLALNLALPRGAGRKMQGLIVVVDPGHGGAKSTGASVVVNGHTLYEKNLTLPLGKKLQEALADSGCNAILTRTRDEDVSLTARPAVAAHNNADLFVSIHMDDCPGANTASGTTVYYHKSDPSSRALAHSIIERILRVSGLPSRGARSDSVLYASGLSVLRNSPVPAVLIEVGYINNARDRSKLTSDEFQQRVAAAICDGIRAYVEGGPPEDALLLSDSK